MFTHRIVPVLLALLIAIAGIGFVPRAKAEEEVVIANNGFMPLAEGVEYPNRWDPERTGNQFDLPAMLELFKAEDICQSGSTAADCQLTPCAQEWYTFIREDLLPGGRCLGYSSMLLKFYHDRDYYQAKFWYDHPMQIWPPAPFQRAMAIDSAKQRLPGMAGAITMNTRTQNVLDVLDSVVQGIWDNNTPVLLITQKLTINGVSRVYGHAVMPRFVSRVGDGPVFRIYVHDPNTKGIEDENYFVALNTDTQQWSYQLRWLPEFMQGGMPTEWSGRNVTGSLNRLNSLDLEYFEDGRDLGVPVCETGANTASLQQTTPQVDEISIVGLGSVVFTDPQGRRLGIIGDQLITDIPGSDIQLPLNDPDMPVVYRVPQPYTVKVTGNGSAVDLIKFGPNNVLRVEGLNPNALGTTVSTSADGRTLTVKSPVQDEFTFGIGQNVDPNSQTGWVRVRNVDIVGGGTVGMTMGSELTLNLANSQGAYDLEVERLRNGGKVSFTSTGIPVVSGDTHKVGYATVEEGSTLPITIDNPDSGEREGTLPDGGTPNIPPVDDGEGPGEDGFFKAYMPMLRR